MRRPLAYTALPMRDQSYRRLSVSFLCLCACVLFGASTSIVAAPFIPKISTPKNFTDVLFGLQELRDNIDTVQCGGWAPESGAKVNGASVEGNVPIPNITPDVPGRTNENPLGDPASGLGERGDFEFPESAFGYLSACNTANESVNDGDLGKPLKDAQGNTLREAVDVKWRGDFENIDGQITFEVVPGTGEIDINPGHWCRLTAKATPRWCEKLFKTWQQLSEFMTENNLRRTNPDCPEPPKEFCFDFPQTKTCTGQECRTPQSPDFWNKSSECHYEIINDVPVLIPDVTGIQKSVSSSFYRHYGNPFSDWTQTKEPSQSPLNVSSPGGTWKLRAECYEYYKEQDPKDFVSEGGQCEIIIKTDTEERPKKPEWQPAGDNSQKGIRKADDSVLSEPSREDRIVPEPWVADTSTNLSIIDIEKLREKQQNTLDPNDIIGSLGMILPIKQRASKSIPDGTHVDMFDDTAERTASSFWEAQQRELLKIMETPTLRLVMPPKSLIGLSSDDPLLRLALHTSTKSDGTVELTLRAGPDDLGSIVESLRRLAIAPIEEVRLPILLPAISDSEIDRRIFEWEQWKILEETDAKEKKRASLSSSADPIIARLKSHRARLEDVRKLSGVLAATVQKLLAPQTEIRTQMSTWYDKAAQMLKDAAKTNGQREEVRKKWREIQEILLSADACQLDWCSDQRFSLPVYSFLDLWWGDEPPGSPRNKEFTPRDWEKKDQKKHDLRDLNIQKVKDYEFDFSDMTFPHKALLVPVLWPIEAPIKIPTPPLVGTKPDALNYPALPPLPDVKVFDAFPKLRVNVPQLPTFTPPPLPDLTEVIRIIGEYEDLFLSMAQRYCAIPTALTTPPDTEQKQGKGSKLIFVENDLKEVIGREFSRWLPNRQEDMAARTARLTKEKSKLSECHEDLFCWLLPDEVETDITSQWFMPDFDVSFTTAAEGLRSLSLPSSESQNPYKQTLPVLDRLFPRLEQPILIDLFVPKPQQ